MTAAKLSRIALRALGRDGSCTPGIIAVKICPDFLSRLKMPDLLICVTGTNGKTTTSNLICSVLRRAGFGVTNNSTGSNVEGGVATALLAASTFTGKPKNETAVIEVDERSSLRIYKHMTPDYLVCNNIMRDSLKRNAHTDFIAYILGAAVPPETKLVLNADDAICSGLCPDSVNRKYFGISAEPGDDTVLRSRDIVYCPVCGGKLAAEYVRYDHIGRLRCTSCGFRSPDPDYCVTVIDRVSGRFTLSYGGGKTLTLKTVNGNIVNIYNCCGAAAVLLEAGFGPDMIQSAFESLEIVKSRFNTVTAGGVKVTMQLAKGQNPVACARAFSYVASLPGRDKRLLIMIDDKSDNTNNSESVCWIYDCDYSALKDPSVGVIVFAGKRCRDHRLRALIAGVDGEKIRICDSLGGGGELILSSGGGDVYILNDPYILKESTAVRDVIAGRLSNAD